jgi:hypothetical protein
MCGEKTRNSCIQSQVQAPGSLTPMLPPLPLVTHMWRGRHSTWLGSYRRTERNGRATTSSTPLNAGEGGLPWVLLWGPNGSCCPWRSNHRGCRATMACTAHKVVGRGRFSLGHAFLSRPTTIRSSPLLAHATGCVCLKENIEAGRCARTADVIC